MQSVNPYLVSVALCTFNSEKHLNEQIDSILAQDYFELEIVIVDDCSSDNTVQILSAYRAKDLRIKLHFNELNLGYIKNFEKAIQLCSGKYIALCDHDDVWENNKISAMVAAIPGNVLVYHDSDFIGDDGERIGNDSLGSRYNMYDGNSSLPFLLFNCISGHSILFDQTITSYALPFNNQFFHDWWIAYVAVNVGKIKFIDKILVHYRQHEYSVTDTLNYRCIGQPRKKSVISKKEINLEWLNYCAGYKYNSNPLLVKKARNQLSNLTQNKNFIQSFLFLVRYFNLLFYISYKTPKRLSSKINILRKIYFS